MKKILAPLLFLILLLPACDQIEISNQITKKEVEIAELKSKNNELILEVKALTAQVARLNASQPGGAAVEELRESLTRKEAELQQREARIFQKEEELRLMVIKVSNLQEDFYSDTGVKLEAIGEARQIKKEYSQMQTSLSVANERANNWLIYISVLGVGLFLSIMGLLYSGIRHSHQSWDIATAMRFVEAGNLDHQDKRLIASFLGKRLNYDD